MRIVTVILTTLLSLVSCNYDYSVHAGTEYAGDYLNEWTVHAEGGEDVAQLIALEFGYAYGGKVLGFPDTYIFYKFDHNMQRRNPSTHHTTNLNNDRRVRWAEQLFTKTRVKRYGVNDSDRILHRVKRLGDEIDDPEGRRIRKRHVPNEYLFNDDLWNFEWYLQDTRTLTDLPRLDLNVLPVYEMGINGSGVRVSVIDDGIEHNHTDLAANYDPEISWDCNDNDPDPMPRTNNKINSHGTRCAGEIAMVANNKKCGVGVAWGSSIGGVRLLDGYVTDRLEGEAIGYAWDKVDIYSASWGPDDSGKTVEGPGRLASEAFKRGITKGRKGKGVIYVWANGNGGLNRDNCNCDGYSSSIYTISIASASQHGLFPWYGEICSSTLATTYSSGAYREQKIATTDINNSCTLEHTGTSAAAPLAAGIIALALSANPNLTWRDVQHLVVWTSEYAPLSKNPGWQTNGVGLRFDIRFGFGLLNAAALVTAALNWTNVPNSNVCAIEAQPIDNPTLETGRVTTIPILVDDCVINYIEHVEVIVSLNYSRRGALEITLLSPQGTNVPILSARPRDDSKAGLKKWSLTSVATWGENPKGLWIVNIFDETNEKNNGNLESITLLVHGTHEMPEHMAKGPRNYNNDYSGGYDESFDSDGIDENIVETPGAPVTQGDELNDAILDEFQDVLLRVHHRNDRNPYVFDDQ